MKKYEIVKKNIDFNDIIKNGNFRKSPYYYIYYKDTYKDKEDNIPKFGLAVSKSIGKAVVRNKIKRQLRVIIDNNKKLFQNNRNYIIMVRKDILNISFQDMEKQLINLMQKGTKNEKN